MCWFEYEERICGDCVNRCAERGDVGDEEYHCPFTYELEECEKLYEAEQKLWKEYYSMLRSGVDEDDPQLVKLGELYDRASEVWDSAYEALRRDVSEDYWGAMAYSMSCGDH